mmetsp:Transcript_6107/g.14187  ORF Transcript_6107/g.14187 Transcript_6107/m.14187 type:complete len:318 (-) Transcript_6107:214-1167(-)
MNFCAIRLCFVVGSTSSFRSSSPASMSCRCLVVGADSNSSTLDPACCCCAGTMARENGGTGEAAEASESSEVEPGRGAKFITWKEDAMFSSNSDLRLLRFECRSPSPRLEDDEGARVFFNRVRSTLSMKRSSLPEEVEDTASASARPKGSNSKRSVRRAAVVSAALNIAKALRSQPCFWNSLRSAAFSPMPLIGNGPRFSQSQKKWRMHFFNSSRVLGQVPGVKELSWPPWPALSLEDEDVEVGMEACSIMAVVPVAPRISTDFELAAPFGEAAWGERAGGEAGSERDGGEAAPPPKPPARRSGKDELLPPLRNASA